MNPTPGGSQKSPLYPDGSGRSRTEGSIANPYNYLIVPNNYTEQKARDFATQIAGIIGRVYPEDEMGAAGLHQALGQMVAAFLQGGSQDLQRHPHWGIPRGSVVPAFVGGASNHLGYVTGLAGLPVDWAEIGGGAANTINAEFVQPIRRLLRWPATSIDERGPFGLSQQNSANISQGYADGVAATEPPSPFNNYDYGPQTRHPADQIGDGNGVADWTSSLPGIDPQEPTPPSWPPLTDGPIRYLSRWTR
jgi:hypothetical protein